MSVNRQRLAIVLSHPTQYYSPWFRWLAAHTDLEFRVFYLWEFGVSATRDPQFGATFKWDVDLLSGYACEFVPNVARDPGTHHFRGLHNPTLSRRLASWSPTAILMFGYASQSQLATLWWARTHRVPVLFRGDSHFLGRGEPAFLRRTALRCLYSQFAAFLSVGIANTAYFRTLGVPQGRIFRAPHSVDASLFAPQSPAIQTDAARLRNELGLQDGTRVVLFAGKFVPAKQPEELLRTFAAQQPRRTALVFVGDGPRRLALRQAADAAKGVDIRFLPFANQSEMPSRYLLADIFVLPSRGHYETWGLAVNEAMHMGVPCLVSDLVGCQQDLVTHRETGWVFRAADRSGLAEGLSQALADIGSPETRLRMRRNVGARIAGYTYEATTAGLLEAVDSLGRRN